MEGILVGYKQHTGDYEGRAFENIQAFFLIKDVPGVVGNGIRMETLKKDLISSLKVGSAYSWTYDKGYGGKAVLEGFTVIEKAS